MLEQPDNEIITTVKQLAGLMRSGQDAVQLVFISIVGGIARTIVSGSQRNFGAFFASVLIAGFVGYLVALGLQDTSIGRPAIGAIVGIAAFSATDILKGIMKISEAFASDPHKAVTQILTLWRKR